MILSSPMTRLCWSLCAWMAWSSSALAQTAPTFTDIGAAAGLTAEGQHHAVAIGDYNNDGFEDIYVGSKFAPNALYRNNGDMTFCLLYTSPSPRDYAASRMPSSA